MFKHIQLTVKNIIWVYFFIFAAASSLFGQWASDSINTIICNEQSDQTSPSITTDGAGGAIIAWRDNRTKDYDIYAQRINADGNILWTSTGVPVCTDTNNQDYPMLTSDGQGGAIIIWEDGRHHYNSINIFDLYAQRINANGKLLWAGGGVPVCTDSSDMGYQSITSDGSGGAIFVRTGFRNDSNRIYVQRINSNGNKMWGADGRQICSELSTPLETQITGDGSHGAIITWTDTRNLIGQVCVQRIDANGNPLWQANGIAICQYHSIYSSIASDGQGGAFITWADNRNNNTSNWNIYAQRINGNGKTLWTQDGIPICTDTSEQLDNQITSFGNGAIITWDDGRNGNLNYDIYAQRIDSGGATLWAKDGNIVCDEKANQDLPQITYGGNGGAIIAWEDQRNYGFNSNDIYAQYISGDGSIPAKYLNVSNQNAAAPGKFQLNQNYPNPFNPSTTIQYQIPKSGMVIIKVYDVLGREVKTLVNQYQQNGKYDIKFDGSNFPSGIYYYRMQIGNFSETKKLILLK